MRECVSSVDYLAKIAVHIFDISTVTFSARPFQLEGRLWPGTSDQGDLKLIEGQQFIKGPAGWALHGARLGCMWTSHVQPGDFLLGNKVSTEICDCRLIHAGNFKQWHRIFRK